MDIDEKYLALQEFLRDREIESQEKKDKLLMEFETLPEEQKEELLEQAKKRLKGERICKGIIKKYEKKLNKFGYFYEPNENEHLDGGETLYYFMYEGNSIKLQGSFISFLYNNDDNEVKYYADFIDEDKIDEEDYPKIYVDASSMEEILKLLEYIHKHPTKSLKYCIDAVFS